MSPFDIAVAFLSLAGTPNQDFCPGYYCSNNMSGLGCQQINVPLLDQLIIKDNPKILKWANCQPDNRTETPPKDLVVWLSYKDTNIWELENSHFANYTNLNVLMMNNNSLQLTKSQAFEGLSLLEFLHLPNNWIYYLPPDVFYPLENIAWIDLRNNFISSLPEDAFRLNTRLKGLDLRKNPLTEIVLPAWNIIRSIDYFLLNDCAKLKEVQLAIDVRIITLERSAVETLKIRGSVQNIRAGNSSLANLDLSGATLNESLLSDILCKSRSLKQLDLSFTKLHTIQLSSGDLYYDCLLPNLRYLNLSHNFIDTLPMGSPLFGSQLETLDLSYNELQNVSLESLKEAHSLRSLYLDGNRLTSFEYESAFDKFKNLSALTVHDNYFNATYNNTITKYLNKPLSKEEQIAPMVAKPKDENVTKAPKDLPKDQKPVEVATKQNVTKPEVAPNVQKTLKGEEVLKNEKAKKVEEEPMDQYFWIWITVPIIVILLVALVWQVMRNRGSDCFGCQPV